VISGCKCFTFPWEVSDAIVSARPTRRHKRRVTSGDTGRAGLPPSNAIRHLQTIFVLASGDLLRVVRRCSSFGVEVVEVDVDRADVALARGHGRAFVIDSAGMSSERLHRVLDAAYAHRVKVILYSNTVADGWRRAGAARARLLMELISAESDPVPTMLGVLLRSAEPSLSAQCLQRIHPEVDRLDRRVVDLAIGLFAFGALPEDVTVVADTAGVDAKTLWRWFTSAGFRNPQSLLKIARIARSYDLLHAGLHLDDVSGRSGFGSVDSMRRAYRTVGAASPMRAQRTVDPEEMAVLLVRAGLK